MNAAEEARAIAYRAQMEARRRDAQARALALAGSPAAARAVTEAWQPITEWLKERFDRDDRDGQIGANTDGV